MSNNKEAKLLDGYWVVETNKWDAKIYTQEQAEKYADTLVNCRNCINCRDCGDCRHCRHSSSCSYSSDCRFCSGCINCSYCRDFKTNPERITSPRIGSRHLQTTYYFTDEHEQIVCGCFRGTLKEFEATVKETHGNNQHAQDYLRWIERVKIYKGGNK